MLSNQSSLRCKTIPFGHSVPLLSSASPRGNKSTTLHFIISYDHFGSHFSVGASIMKKSQVSRIEISWKANIWTLLRLFRLNLSSSEERVFFFTQCTRSNLLQLHKWSSPRCTSVTILRTLSNADVNPPSILRYAFYKTEDITSNLGKKEEGGGERRVERGRREMNKDEQTLYFRWQLFSFHS